MPRSGLAFDNNTLGSLGVVVGREVNDLRARRSEGDVGVKFEVVAVQSQVDRIRRLGSASLACLRRSSGSWEIVSVTTTAYVRETYGK